MVKKQTNCVHYWKIGESHGEYCRAVCKYCGAKTVLMNVIPTEDRVIISNQLNAMRKKLRKLAFVEGLS